MINSMSKVEFLNKKPIYVEHIEEGFAMYPAIILMGHKVGMKQFIERMLTENRNSSYVDFHYAKLTEGQKEHFKEGLDKKERECLALFEVKDGQVFYPLNQLNLEFLADITAREWLFSSFYFVEHKVTVWGNYEMQYPVFAKDQDTLYWCADIAKEYDILVKNS